MTPSPPPHRLSLLAFLLVVMLVGPGCVSWNPVVFPAVRWLLALFS